MPLKIPTLDDRNYQELLDEALARIPVHTPEWTNFNRSDPGVTLIEIFAFLTENLLYRANQIPERNRLKFLSLLGIPLTPASPARGIVAFVNERVQLQTVTLNKNLEVRAGEVPFRTESGLDVLPVESGVYYKRKLKDPSPGLVEYYRQLYESYKGRPPAADLDLRLYETVPLSLQKNGIDLSDEAVDGSLWVALLFPPSVKSEADRDRTLGEIAGRTLSMGIVPMLEDAGRHLVPGGHANPEGLNLLEFKMPKVPAGGKLPDDPLRRTAEYKALDVRAPIDVLARPGVVQIILPGKEEFALWSNLDPLERGVGDFPPALEDGKLNERIISWIRISPSAAVRTKLLWAGINAAPVSQRAHIANERLAAGSGEPDQSVVLSRTPVIPGSVRLTIDNEDWEEIDDLTRAGSEVPVTDPRQVPGRETARREQVKVFAVNPESGEIRFGDGVRGMRPPLNAAIRADYDFGVGRAGNVGAAAINGGPALPSGIKVANPVSTWGGAEAEGVSDGEKQIARYLQHRDRLVNAADFETIVRRTPGLDIGRVEVIPAYNPELGQNEPGDAPGAVTLMIIPKYDQRQPDAPLPDRLFTDTVCSYVESRRLVTTEVFLRGPDYKAIWVSLGINVVAAKSTSIAEVREAVKTALLAFLAPLGENRDRLPGARPAKAARLEYAGMEQGWPLRKPVNAMELVAVASRVEGVMSVTGVLLGEETGVSKPEIGMKGLQLPRVIGISVTIGEPAGLDQLRGEAGTLGGLAALAAGGPHPVFVSVPAIPEECK